MLQPVSPLDQIHGILFAGGGPMGLGATAGAVAGFAILVKTDAPVEPLAVRELSTAAASVGVEIQSVEVRSPDDFPAAFATLSSGRVHALLALAPERCECSAGVALGSWRGATAPIFRLRRGP